MQPVSRSLAAGHGHAILPHASDMPQPSEWERVGAEGFEGRASLSAEPPESSASRDGEDRGPGGPSVYGGKKNLKPTVPPHCNPLQGHQARPRPHSGFTFVTRLRLLGRSPLGCLQLHPSPLCHRSPALRKKPLYFARLTLPCACSIRLHSRPHTNHVQEPPSLC